jgi:putative salt-induced outer membrane protein YdiY
MKQIFAAILTVIFFGFTATAQAGVIVLKNGDRITGEIKAIWDKEVLIEPEYADEFTIDQDKILSIESDKTFEIELRNEDMVSRSAKFKGADESGEQLVEVDGELTQLSLMKIGELDEFDDFFEWSFNGDLNAEINSGNTESTDVAVTTDWYLKYGKQKHYVDTLWQKEEQDDPETGQSITTVDRQRYRYNLNYDIGDPWFTGAFGIYETDEIKGLEYRYSAGPTLGYRVWDNARKSLSFQLGYGYEEDETKDINDVKQSDGGGIALAIIKFEYDLGDPDLRFYLTNTTTKAQYGRKNTVTQFNAGAKYDITDLLYFNLETLIDYESDPVEGASNEDIQILIGIGVEFDN